MMSTEILQLGAVAIIFLFSIKEFFLYLKTKKNGNGNEKIVKELRLMNANHLNSINKSLNMGFDRVIETLNSNERQVIQLLGEIKGKLSSK